MTQPGPHKRRTVVDLRKGGEKIAVKREQNPQAVSFKRYAFVIVVPQTKKLLRRKKSDEHLSDSVARIDGAGCCMRCLRVWCSVLQV